MPSYSYVVINKDGKEMKGSVEAESQDKVYSMLKADGSIPISVSEQNLLNKDISLSFMGKVKPRDLSVFCRQFVSIISAGVTIIDALNMLSEETSNKKLKKAIKETKISVEKGETLANAMRRQEEAFPPLLINMVEAGEASGSLEISLERMAEHFEKDSRIKAMVKKAMIYPCAVGIVSVAVIIVMLTVVIPKFTAMFDDIGVKMPAITVFVINLSNFLLYKWYVVLIALILIVTIFRAYKQSEQGEINLAKLGLKAPLFGNLNIKIASSRFSRTLSTLISAGIPLVSALELTAKSQDNVIVKRELNHCKEEVEKGVALSVPIELCGIFPPMVYHMIKIGEETGNMESMLTKLADYYDEEVEISTQSLMAALEPIIILVLASIVCVIIAAIMSPIMAMYAGLDKIQ